MTPGNGEYGRKVLAAVMFGESVGRWWFGRGSAVWEEPHLGFQHGRPWAPEPDGWIFYHWFPWFEPFLITRSVIN